MDTPGHVDDSHTSEPADDEEVARLGERTRESVVTLLASPMSSSQRCMSSALYEPLYELSEALDGMFSCIKSLRQTACRYARGA